jgi:hypothetical protein
MPIAFGIVIVLITVKYDLMQLIYQRMRLSVKSLRQIKAMTIKYR